MARILRQVSKFQKSRGDGEDSADPSTGADPVPTLAATLSGGSLASLDAGPPLAALLRSSLFGRHELERTLRVVPGQPLPTPPTSSPFVGRQRGGLGPERHQGVVDLWPPDELPLPEFDAVDEPGAEDWAA